MRIVFAALALTAQVAHGMSASGQQPIRRSPSRSRGQLDGKVVVWPPAWVPESLADSLEADSGAGARAVAAKASHISPGTSAYTPPTWSDNRVISPIEPSEPSVFELVFDNVRLGAKADGEKGAGLFAAQVALCAFVAGGDIPMVGDLVRVDLATLAMIGGLLSLTLGTLELGPALSPWTLPAENDRSELRTDGAYGLARHPMYTGLLLLCVGFAVLTDSATRLGLTLVLAWVLNQKADLEETALEDKYGEAYGEYSAKVSKRFLPFLF